MSGADAHNSDSGTVSGMSETEEQATTRDRFTRAFMAFAAIALIAGLTILIISLVQRNAAEERAKEREAAVSVASQVLVNAYSFDFNNVEQAISSLAEASTGDFLAQQQQWGPQVSKLVTDQQAVTKAEIGNAAVQAFDPQAGTATVLFVFTAQSERKNQPSVTGRQAARVDVQRIDDRWKVSGVIPVGVVVPVGKSSASVQGLTGPTGSGTAPKSPPAPTSKPASSSTPAAPARPGQ